MQSSCSAIDLDLADGRVHHVELAVTASNVETFDRTSKTEMTESTKTKHYLIITSAKDWCDIFTLKQNRAVTVGRSGSNDIVVSDDKTSRKHCVIRFRKSKNQWIVQDLDSMNGTYLNGERIERRAILSVDDSISVATAVIKFTDKIGKEDESQTSFAFDDFSEDESTIMLSRKNDPTDLELS
jgi:hypothetical protein